MNVGWRRSTGLGLSPVAAASTEATRRHVDVQGMGEWLTYRFAPITTDMKLSVALSEDRARPLTGLPTATVLVDSPISGSAGLVPITLGGNSESSNSLRDGRAQFTADLAWYTWNRSHRIDVFTDLELERSRSSEVPNTFGTFSFNSTRDLIEGTPAVFERTLGRAATVVPVFRGALAVGDVYTPGGAGDFRSTGDGGVTIQYGLRADVERFGRFGAANPQAASLFGIQTGIPRPSFTVQPMIGFTWNWSRYSIRVQDLQMLRHRNTLSGGIREYRGTVGLSTLAATGRQSGMSNGLTALRCVGDAVPAPDWSSYSRSIGSIPSACLDGSSTVFDQRAPSIAAFDRGYTPLVRWSSELTFSHDFTPFLTGVVTGAYSRLSHVSDIVDLNFEPTGRFELADEAGRPVFVSVGSIVPTSGAISSIESRVSGAYGRVAGYRSDARMRQRQLTGMLKYSFGNSLLRPAFAGYPRVSGTIALSYTIAGGWTERRGFTGTTSGDPLRVTRAPLVGPRHTFRVSAALARPTWWSLRTSAALSSGFAFTPIVSGDINGDGSVNDGAFVFADAADPTVRRGLENLLTAAPSAAVRCLRRQLGRIAARNSCRGPWTASVGTIALTIDPYRLHLGLRGNITFSVSNALTALDQLLHGSARLHGWGGLAWPDPVLLQVQGFDSQRREFVYAVNPRFGSTTGPQRVNLNPATLTVDVRWNIGPSPEATSITRIVDAAPPVLLNDSSEVKLRLLRRAGLFRPDIDIVLAAGDSIRLEPGQVERLQAVRDQLRMARDSIYTELAGFLASRVDDLDVDQVREHWHSAGVGVLRAIYDAGARARAILSERQQQWLRANRSVPSLWYTREWLDRSTRAPIVTLR